MKSKIFFYLKGFLKVLIIIVLIGFLLPINVISPIERKQISKIDPESFWYFPWGESGVHKGIDIFSDSNTNVKSPIYGFVYKMGYGTISGNYINILGPKWRIYYFAHLDTIFISNLSFVSQGSVIGKVGNSGNAINRPSHLHFSIETIFPYFWLYDNNTLQGDKKMFYLDPNKYVNF